MAKHTYKNTTDQELTIPNHGVVEPGKTIESDVPIENPNLEEVKTKSKDKK